MSAFADTMEVVREEDLSGDGKLLKYVYQEGEGDHPSSGSTVHVHYRGTFENGHAFDCSYNRGLFSFKLGASQVIRGWDIGVSTMKVGEKAQLVVDSSYGYGDHGYPPIIPAKATLHFDVELKQVD